MQLFSVDQQRSQALEAHAASFAQFKVRGFPVLHFTRYDLKSCLSNVLVCVEQVPGNENPSILISFATKTFNAGQITSKLHVIELGAQPAQLALLSFILLLLFLYGEKQKAF